MNRFSFTAADIKRAIKAVEASGKQIAAVDFPREGGFRCCSETRLFWKCRRWSARMSGTMSSDPNFLA